MIINNAILDELTAQAKAAPRLCGHQREVYYDAAVRITDTIDLIPGDPVVGLCIPIGQLHTVQVLESRQS